MGTPTPSTESGRLPSAREEEATRFWDFAQPNSEVRNSDTFGVLKLTLSPGKFKWEFVPEAGGNVSRFR